VWGTFQQVANEYLLRFESSWKNWRHTIQWRTTLVDYVYPVLGSTDVEKIATDDVLRVLLPIWGAKPETAARMRGRIEAVLSFAGIDPNPARWKGHLEHRLAARNRARDVKHLTALDWRDVSAFMTELRNRDSDIAALALEFTILTACRAGEVLGATWDEIDLQDRTWTIPKERMKRDREHRVPLSDDAIAVLERMGEVRHSDTIFPVTRNTVLRRLQEIRPGVTIHGFRSTFRDWASEQSSVPDRIVEAALAHVVGDRTEAAYRRGDLFERRRELMQAWARYCGQDRNRDFVVVEMKLPA
jgi:integrase